MGKYLHYYKKEEDFQKDYNGDSPITAFTVVGGRIATGCNKYETVETTPFDGKKFVFDREVGPVSFTLCNGNTIPMEKVQYFKNGNDEVLSNYNQKAGWEHENGMVEYIQDVSSVTQAGDYRLFISSLEYGDGPYHEPWVSATDYKEMTVNTFVLDYGEYNYKCEYVGEVDVYQAELQ